MKKRGYDAERELVGMMREQGFDCSQGPSQRTEQRASP